MSYAQLVADLTLNSRAFEQGLQFCDNLGRSFTRANWVVPIRLDTKSFGQQVGKVKSVLSNIGNLSVPVDLNVRVNGQAVAVKNLEQVGQAARAASTDINVAHKNLNELGSGTTNLRLNTKDVMKGLDEVRAGVLRYKNEFSSSAGIGDITGTINKLERFFSGQGIKADGFNRVIPELTRVLEMQQQVGGRRILDIDIRVDPKGFATINNIDVEINGMQKELSALFSKLETGGKSALLPFLRGITDVDQQLTLARRHVDELTAAGAKVKLGSAEAIKFKGLDTSAAQAEALKINKMYESLTQRGFSGAAVGTLSSRFSAETLAGIQKLHGEYTKLSEEAAKVGMSLQPMDALLATAVGNGRILWENWRMIEQGIRGAIGAQENFNAAGRRNLADQLRSQGIAASVIGGERNINARGAASAGVGGVTDEMAVKWADLQKQIVGARSRTQEFEAAVARANQMVQQTGSSRWSEQFQTNVDKAEEAIAKAERRTTLWGAATKGLIGQLRAVGNTIARWAIGYGVVSQLINLVGALKYAIFDYNDALDKADITFTAQLNGNSKATKVLIHDLEDLTALTPFKFDQLLPLSQRLKDAGRNAATLRQDLTSLGDYMARVGKGPEVMERVIYAINQIHVAGRLQGQEVRQLVNAFVPALDILAKAWGITTAEMKKAIGEGIVPADKAIEALISGMGERGFGFMAKQAKTFGGAMSTLGDLFNILVGGAMRNFYESTTRTALFIGAFVQNKNIQIWFEELQIKIENTISKFVVFMQFGADLVNRLLPIMGAGLLGIAAYFVGIGIAATWAFVTTLPATIASAATSISSIIVLARTAQVAWAYVPAVILAGVVAATMSFSALIDALYAMLEKLPGKAGAYFKSEQAYWEQTKNDYSNGADVVREAIKGKLDNIASYFLPDTAKLKQGWQEAGASVGKAFQVGAKPTLPHYSTADFLSSNKGDSKALNHQASTLDQIAAGYDKAAKAAEASGKRQLDAIRGVRDILRDVFGSISDELAKYGVFNSPLDGLISRIEKLANLGPRAGQIALQTMKDVSGFNTSAASYRDQAKTLRDKAAVKDAAAASSDDGSGATASVTAVGGNGLGDKIAAAAVRMQARAANFVHQCDRLADTTVRSVTTAFSKIMGPRSHDTAARTMARFMAAGIGFAPTGSYQAGDIAYTGSRVGGGAGHVQIIGPDGRFLDQYGAHKKPTTVPEWVVRPGGNAVAAYNKAAGNARLANALGKAAGANTRAANSAAGDSPDDLVKEIQGMLSDLKISKLAPLPKEWGKPIKDAEKQANQFRVQMILANGATQNLLRASLGEKGFAALVKQLREGTFVMDRFLTRQKAMAKVQEDINAGVREARGRGHENDPVWNLAQELAPGGKLNVTLAQWAQRSGQVIGDVDFAVKKSLGAMRNSFGDRLSVAKAGAAFSGNGPVDEYGMTRAQDLQQRKIEFRNSDDMKKQWNTNRAGFNKSLADFSTLDATQYDFEKGEERRLSVKRLRDEYDLTRSSLEKTLRIVTNTTLGETALSDELARQETVLKKASELQLKGGFTAEKAKQLAEEFAGQEQIARVLERQIQAQKDLAQFRFQTQSSLSLGRSERNIYGSMSGNDPQLQMNLEQVRKLYELNDQAASNPELIASIGERFAAFVKLQQSQNQTNRLAESSAKVSQMEVDLIQKRYEMLHGLTEVQKTLWEFQKLGAATSEEEANNRAKALDLAKEMDALKPSEWKKQGQMDAILNNPALTDKSRSDLSFVFDKKLNAGWTDDAIKEALPIDRAMRKLRESQQAFTGILDDWKSSWTGMWEDMSTKGVFSLNSMLTQMQTRLAKFGADFLANQAWQGLLKLVGGSLANVFGAGTKASAPVTGSFGGGGVNLGGSVDGSFAVGLRKVPRDNFRANLHQGEEILTAAESNDYSMARAALEIARGAAAATGRSGSSSSAEGSDGGVHFYGPVSFPGVRRESDLPGAINEKKNQVRNSRRTNQKHAQAVVSNGF